MAKFDPFLSLDCTRVEGVGGEAIQGKEGIKFCNVAERSHNPEARRAKHIQSENFGYSHLAIMVLTGEDADGRAVLLPAALPAHVVDHAAEQDVAAGVHLLVGRLL